MADEPSLPTLPKGQVTFPFGDRSARKRGLSFYGPPSSSTSSDPAMFSSDDDPAVDNYQGQGRRKKRYIGTWYDQQPALSSDSAMGADGETPQASSKHRAPAPPAIIARRQKREFKKLDSGIYMSQDGGLTDTDLEELAPNHVLPIPPRVEPRVRLSDNEMEAQDRIISCFEEGKEVVPLDGLGLESISDQILEPIAQIRPVPTVEKDVSFEHQDPAIKVFLSHNALKTVPMSLFNVEFLTVLTLRSNCLTEIPAAIGKLQNLEELNISQNQIRFLPAELLDLTGPGKKLQKLYTQPNPFWHWILRPGTFDEGSTALEIGMGEFGQADPEIYSAVLTRTPVEFLDGAQQARSTFRLPLGKDSLSDSEVVLETESLSRLEVPRELGMEQRSRGATTRVLNPRGARSLFELALHACVKSGHADEISAWLKDEDLPAGFAEAVDEAAKVELQGGMTCAVCGRQMVLPMTRWVEWHVFRGHSYPHRTGLPFLKHGCSWKCVPPLVEPAPEAVSTGDDSDFEDEDTITA
ncbi:hypothetical protein QBC35DRAFT_424021 [Podospora australis]|uniref:Leucine-rich repeat-containing protein n=1 Tax=Podospora australis TaxID=1536484 RepID=A0AAN7AMS2_9PEZI|nr:hypothetical protein QBC35DRAFT_424021 [Podospora australis]